MKILITGNRGLIGSRIEEKLNLLHDVKGIDIKDFIYKEDIYDFFRYKEEKFDMIIHCGANCIIRDIIQDPELAFDNVKTTNELMEFARRIKCKKVIMFSSSRVEHDNKNPYIANKKYVEDLVKAYKECYGVDYIIIRPETVWGERDNKDRVIPRWINQAINNKPITVYGNKNKTLPPVHVDEFTKQFLEYFNNWNKYKNTTIKIAGKHLKVDKIISIIKKVTNSKSKIIYTKKELSQPQDISDFKYKYSSDEKQFEKRLRDII